MIVSQKNQSLRDRVEEFISDPSPATFAGLVTSANIVLEDANNPWMRVSKMDNFFDEIRVDIELSVDSLSQDEIDNISGCIGYALKQTIAGESLSDATSIEQTPFAIGIEYFYDATKTQRDDPDFIEAFELAQKMVIEGTPIRSTNRAGEGTKGTRLVNGLGNRAKSVTFYLR